MRAMKRQRGDYQPRDREMFRFLWEWKLATTQAIARKFWPNCNSDAAYKRLHQLRRRGYVELVSLDRGGSQFAWTLDNKGFEAILSQLPPLKEEGYRSESLEHDHYVMACHLGEWLSLAQPGVELFSEQQIRRIDCSSYPSWVPGTDRHRPDGYWRVPCNRSFLTIALEVERSFKTMSIYEVIAYFYELQTSIDRIVWVVDPPGTAKSICAVMERMSPSTYLRHDFVLLKDFKSLHWQAPIIMGFEQGKTLGFLLGIRTESSQSHSRSTCDVSAILDTQKRRATSTPSSVQAKDQITHCMALPAIQSNHKGQTL